MFRAALRRSRKLTRNSIGLPPAGKFHIDLDPTSLVFRNQSIQGTLVSSAQEIDETLEFASRGKTSVCMHESLLTNS